MVLVLDTDHVANGYEPRCTVCNCEYQVEIEVMRENNKTFEEIRQFMDNNGVKISLMAFLDTSIDIILNGNYISNIWRVNRLG